MDDTTRKYLSSDSCTIISPIPSSNDTTREKKAYYHKVMGYRGDSGHGARVEKKAKRVESNMLLLLDKIGSIQKELEIAELERAELSQKYNIDDSAYVQSLQSQLEKLNNDYYALSAELHNLQNDLGPIQPGNSFIDKLALECQQAFDASIPIYGAEEMSQIPAKLSLVGKSGQGETFKLYRKVIIAMNGEIDRLEQDVKLAYGKKLIKQAEALQKTLLELKARHDTIRQQHADSVHEFYLPEAKEQEYDNKSAGKTRKTKRPSKKDMRSTQVEYGKHTPEGRRNPVVWEWKNGILTEN